MLFHKRQQLLLLLLISIITIGPLTGQTYRFTNYTPEMGLPGKFVYNINQDKNGFLWVGTGSGMAMFDGYDFYSVQLPDTTITGYPVCSFSDSHGTLWFGYSDGSVLYYENDLLKKIEEVKAFRINDITETPDGTVIAVTQTKGLYAISPGKNRTVRNIAVQGSNFLNTVRFTDNNHFFAGTQQGIIECRIEGEVAISERTIPGLEYQKIEALYIGPTGHLVAGTEDDGIYTMGPGSDKMIKAEGPEWFSYAKVQQITSDGDKGVWLSTFGSGLLRVRDITNIIPDRIQLFDKESGLPGPNVKALFLDREGNKWIGLYGDGLSMIASEALTFITPGSTSALNDLIWVGSRNESIILGTRTGYYSYDPDIPSSRRWVSLSSISSKAPIATYHTDKNGALWIGTDGAGLWYSSDWKNFKNVYKGLNSGENIIVSIDSDKDNIWLGTNDGAVVLSRSTYRKREVFNTQRGLSHNSIRQVKVRPDGRAYLITESDKVFTAMPNESVTAMSAIISGPMQNRMETIEVEEDGTIWVGTKGNGLFRIKGDKAESITTQNGLMSDYIYSLHSDAAGYLWVGHQRGLSIVHIESGTIKTLSTDFANNGDCNHNALFEDRQGRVYIGTSTGLILFDRSKENMNQGKALMNVISIQVDDKIYGIDEPLNLPYRSRYIVKIAYSGISFSNRNILRYKTQLERFDRDWSEPMFAREVVFPLSSGNYRFLVKAVDESGRDFSNVAEYSFSVRKPIWRMWWFFVIVISVLGATVVMIIRLREEAARKRRVELEDELARRTQEVMLQKEEIEHKNREITDSINYAQRIQASILPEFERVLSVFPEAFMLYRPKQIVSGDFYWFERLDEDHFMFICADSTGHGVPGAFMSMIGSALIQDIVKRRGVWRPSEVLTLLDREVTSTLSQNDSSDGGSNDGMDIVVCNFNIKTRQLLFSSAMRPVILVLGGESFYVKGNRSSIGGDFVGEKMFDDQEYYMAENDSIYLFSDGYPDQFGGPNGKKMKIIRVKALLEEISSENMLVQKSRVESNFVDWMGKTEQVDDVLFIGIRF